MPRDSLGAQYPVPVPLRGEDQRVKNRKRSKCSTPAGVAEFAAVVVDKDPVELAIALAKERATPEGAVRIADSIFCLNATRELLETQPLSQSGA